jgi:probable HAF family extracellular repeat protein
VLAAGARWFRAGKVSGGADVPCAVLGGTLVNAWPTAINDHNQVIGPSGASSSMQGHAFVWENGVMTDLAPAARASEALAINDKGQIVGWITAGGGRTHAVLWTLRSG